MKKLEKLISSSSSQATNTQARQQEALTKTQESLQMKTPTRSEESVSNRTQNLEASSTFKQVVSILSTKKNTENKKKKVVRFDEKTILTNNNLPKNDSSKGHFTVSDIVEKVSKEKSSNFVLQPKVSILKKISFDDDSSPISARNKESNPSSIASSYREDDYSSNPSCGSNNTVILEDDQDITSNFDTSKLSFYEYESILLPKTSKYVDYLSNTSQIINILNEKEENEETLVIDEPKKESRKDKKIIKSEIPCNETVHLTLMSMELHAITRGNMYPDPEKDKICLICYTIYNQSPSNQVLFEISEFETHLIIYDGEKRSLSTSRFLGILPSTKKYKSIQYAYREEEMFDFVLKAISYYDPDILIGFELQKLSWCYLVRRAYSLKIDDFLSKISRVPKGKILLISPNYDYLLIE